MNWLSNSLTTMSLSEECEEYLLRRGVKRTSFEKMGEVTWTKLEKPCPNSFFKSKYGEYGERLCDMLTCPLYSPKGEIIGFEARDIYEKKMTRFLLPKAEWNAVWIAHKDSVEKIWKGCTVWIVEGRFDLYSMEWVVPPTDVVLCSLRASLTPYHIDYLQRLKPQQVNMVYDQDETGKKGSFFAQKKLNSVYIPCEIINFVGGKDPNEIWSKGGLPLLQKSFRHSILL